MLISKLSLKNKTKQKKHLVFMSYLDYAAPSKGGKSSELMGQELSCEKANCDKPLADG